MYYIGIMTGNSLDAVDVVITKFDTGNICDILGYSCPIPVDVADRFRKLKSEIKLNNGDIQKVYDQNISDFLSLHNDYINIVAQTVNSAVAQSGLTKKDIKAIGFHGQTCYHCPPSVSKHKPNTLQIGSGQILADLTGIKVAYDFRADDIMNGGEGAPLAPIHNLHIAKHLPLPVAFLNGGNTGNISIIAKDEKKEFNVFGWDVGPFNHFIDYLARKEQNVACDFDGEFGKKGIINYKMLRELFTKAVTCSDNSNFIDKLPPKSSDPAWYRILPCLQDKSISFYDRIRTVEFFSAYIMAYNLSFAPNTIQKLKHFITFGGGWKNPTVKQDFINLVSGLAQVLPEHKPVFDKIINPEAIILSSDEYGYSSQYMEARIFADMAYCLDHNIEYSTPEVTGCKTPTICGIFAYPGGSDNRLWSRASFGWQDKI